MCLLVSRPMIRRRKISFVEVCQSLANICLQVYDFPQKATWMTRKGDNCSLTPAHSRMRQAQALWKLILYPETRPESSSYVIKLDIEVTGEETHNRMSSSYNTHLLSDLGVSTSIISGQFFITHASSPLVKQIREEHCYAGSKTVLKNHYLLLM